MGHAHRGGDLHVLHDHRGHHGHLSFYVHGHHDRHAHLSFYGHDHRDHLLYGHPHHVRDRHKQHEQQNYFVL